MVSFCRLVKEWCALPAAWVGVIAIAVLGTTLGGIQLVFALLMVVFSPILRLCFLGIVRHIYPTRVGQVHVWFMMFVRDYWMRKKTVQPIRVDLSLQSEKEVAASVHVVSALIDNYTYIVVERASMEERQQEGGGFSRPLRCCVIDPGDAEATIRGLEYLREQHYFQTRRARHASKDGKRLRAMDVMTGVEVGARSSQESSRDETEEDAWVDELVVTSILVTHKHWDHQAGVRKVVESERARTKRANKMFPEEFPVAAIDVVAGELEKGVVGRTRAAKAGSRLKLGNLTFEIVLSPCHTLGHIMFALLESNDENVVHALFTGDTLFCGGCGAPFEGTGSDTAANFRSIYHRCNDATLLFPGHEYSEPLLLDYFGGSQPTPRPPHQFAALCHALQRARDCRLHHRPTVPVVLGSEILYNSNFASLHKASGSICDAFRIFARAINYACASQEAVEMLRNEEEGRRDSRLRKNILNYLEMKSSRAVGEFVDRAPPSLQFGEGAPPAAESSSDDHVPLTGGLIPYSTAGADTGSKRGAVRRASSIRGNGGATSSRKPEATESLTIRHRVKLQRGWRPGSLAAFDVCGVPFDCPVPEGLVAGDEFDVRIPRDRLPKLLCYTPQDFSDPISTVWRRDLERLHSLAAASTDDPDPSQRTEAIHRTQQLSRVLLSTPLRDIRDYDGEKKTSRTKLIPRARYRGGPDEHAAQLSVEDRDDSSVATATWQDSPQSPPVILGLADVDRLLSAKRRVPDSFAALGRAGNADNQWRIELRLAVSIFDAMCAISSSADLRPGDDPYEFYDDSTQPTITKGELRRALTMLGPRPLSHSQVDELVELAEIAACADESGSIDIRELACVLGNDVFSEPSTPPPPKRCRCCRRRRRRAPPPATADAEIEILQQFGTDDVVDLEAA